MKKNLFISIVLLLTLAGIPTQAQVNTLASTTLSAAVTSESATVIRVASASGFVVGYTVYVDGEAMSVTAISGTQITVFRGIAGTQARTHLSGSTVLVGTPQTFTTVDVGPGSCTVLGQRFVNTVNGNVWLCRGVTLGSYGWTATNSRQITYNSLTIS